ncbi:MAG: hypothetical protein U0T07_09025 [Chitinophagales bacterium]
MLNTPILFLIFNRPDTTRQVFAKIREIQPKQLFIAADGPRADRAGEAEKCALTKQIAMEAIDWDCEVKTLFRTENLGCGVAPAQAITWFFEHVEQGIILEDDCLPDLSFFTFCEELLNYYKDDTSVMHIGGTNSQFGRKRGNASYYFSKYPHIWGWATWKRTWQQFQFSFSKDDNDALPSIFEGYRFSQAEKEYWENHWNLIKDGERKDIWDIQWTFSCWLNYGKTIVPNYNLISNIGFHADATHTFASDSALANLSLKRIEKIQHPIDNEINIQADGFTFRKYNLMEPSFSQKIKTWFSDKIPTSLKIIIKKQIP